MTPASTNDAAPEKPCFVTTHWSVVFEAGHGDTSQARDALGRLFQTYWYPLYAYVRRCGYSPEDAQDLTQGFFAHLLERRRLATADQNKGRFRSFLLGALKHFLVDERARLHAQKRGGGLPTIPLQLDSAETRYGLEPADASTPERSFEKRWTLAMLDDVLNRLRAEYEREGKSELFSALHPCLVGDRTAQPYADLSRRLGLSESALKSTVHRLRRRYRRLLRDEIALTVASPDEVDDELKHLFAVLAR